MVVNEEAPERSPCGTPYDCGAFDPVHYIPKEGKDALGIRLALAIAEETSYIYSLNLNNLTLKLPAEKTA